MTAASIAPSPPWLGLQSIAHELPTRHVTSDELAASFTDETGHAVLRGQVLTRLTGVSTRRYADPGISSSDLAAAATVQALEGADVDPLQIDTLIFAAASHDVAEPATANRVQELTGCDGARVLDVKNACNSFLDGLAVARALLISGEAQRIVVATGEVLSPFVRMTVPPEMALVNLIGGLTLGDGGAAALVGPPTEEDLCWFGPGHFRSIGQHWSASRIMSGGSMLGADFREAYFVSDSTILFGLAVKHVPRMVRRVLEAQRWSSDDVDLVIPHQASTAVVRKICAETSIPLDRCVITAPDLGNTAAASIPIAMAIASQAGRLTPGTRGLLVGGAAGFSAAAMPFVVPG